MRRKPVDTSTIAIPLKMASQVLPKEPPRTPRGSNEPLDAPPAIANAAKLVVGASDPAGRTPITPCLAGNNKHPVLLAASPMRHRRQRRYTDQNPDLGGGMGARRAFYTG